MMLASRISCRPCKAAAPQAKRAPVPSRLVACRAAATKDVKREELKKEDAVVPVEDLPDPNISTKEVQKFLTMLVNDTSIAQLQLQVGSFEMNVKRSVAPAVPTPAAAPAAAAPVAPAAPVELAPVAPEQTSKTIEETIDESLIPIVSPKVGIFRRGKYAGGKRIGKGNAASEGDQIKKGQIIGYVEQLGTFVPVEAPQAGEIVKFHVEDGKPVEYQQAVLEIVPFFGGHIVGNARHA